MRNSGEHFMPAATRTSGHYFLTYWSTLTRHGQRMPLFSSCSFRESDSSIMRNPQSLIPMTREQLGKISPYKAFARDWWCMEWKVSITTEPERNFKFPTHFKLR